jgi:hypothetical protein
LSALEWTALTLLTLAFVYTEGHRAIQKRFTPHLVDRLRVLQSSGSVIDCIAAPLFALSLLHAPRRALLRAWAGVLAIVAAVFIVRAFPEPWRGITDLAVAAALSWGLVAILRAATRLLFRREHETIALGVAEHRE